MAETIDDITIRQEEDGILFIEELDKHILTKGLWTTIMFRYHQYDPDKGEYGPDLFTIRRYKKVQGQFRYQSKFNISSIKQAKSIVETLEKWIKEAE